MGPVLREAIVTAHAAKLIGVFVVLGWAASGGAAAEPSRLKPSLYLAVESPRPLDGIRQGENVELFFLLTNGRVIGIERLVLKLESDSNLQIVGKKGASFRNIAATGGSIRAGIKCKLKSSMGTLTVSYSAKYFFDEGVTNGLATIVVGRSAELAPQEVSAAEIRSEIFDKTLKAFRNCVKEESHRDPSFEVDRVDLRIHVESTGVIGHVESAESDPSRSKLESCLKEATSGIALPSREQPADIHLPLVLRSRGEVLLLSVLGTRS